MAETAVGPFEIVAADQEEATPPVLLTNIVREAAVVALELEEYRKVAGDIQHRFIDLGINLADKGPNLLQADFWGFQLGICTLNAEYSLRLKHMTDAEMKIFERAFAGDLRIEIIRSRQEYIKTAFSSGIPGFNKLLEELLALTV